MLGTWIKAHAITDASGVCRTTIHCSKKCIVRTVLKRFSEKGFLTVNV